MDNKPNEPYQHTFADWFVPVYETVLERGENGERFPVRYFYMPPGFKLTLILCVLSLLKAIW